jgi:phage shock protein A
MEMYYTKKEYNSMKSALTRKVAALEKQVAKLQNKIKELEYTKEVVFEPDFVLDPVTTEPSVD